jgi:tetratricopeptide (TPR) repeat protein
MFSWESLIQVRDAGDSAGRRRGPDPLAALTDLLSDADIMAHSFLALWLCGMVGLDRRHPKDATRIMEIPRLIQEMWLGPHRQTNLWPYGYAVVRTLNHAFSAVRQQGGDAFMHVLPHLLVALRRTATLPGSTVTTGMTLFRLGEWLIDMQAHGPAQALLSASLPLMVDAVPRADPRGPQIAQSRALVRLAECQMAQNDLFGATASARRALALVSDGSHDEIDVANAENVLGVALGTQEDYAAAEPHLLRAEALMRQKHGKDPACVACQLNLGQTQIQLGKSAEAEKTLRRALQVLTEGKVYSERRSRAHHYLGQALYNAGSKHEARRHFEASLELDQRLVPGDHPRVGINLAYLVTLASERGDTKAARAMAERALPILMATQQVDPGILSLYRAVQQTLNQGGSPAAC